MNETTSVRSGLLRKQNVGGTAVRIHNRCVQLQWTVNSMLQPASLPPLFHRQDSGWATPPLWTGWWKNTPSCLQSILDRPDPGQSFYWRNFQACRIANAWAHNLETRWILINNTAGEWNFGTHSGRWMGRSTGPDTGTWHNSLAPAGNQNMDPPLCSPQLSHYTYRTVLSPLWKLRLHYISLTSCVLKNINP